MTVLPSQTKDRIPTSTSCPISIFQLFRVYCRASRVYSKGHGGRWTHQVNRAWQVALSNDQCARPLSMRDACTSHGEVDVRLSHLLALATRLNRASSWDDISLNIHKQPRPSPHPVTTDIAKEA